MFRRWAWGGLVRRGSWTPVRLDLFNETPEVRDVVCRWLLSDADGDRVVSERTVTLSPQTDQSVWLYADPPLTQRLNGEWVFQIVDRDTQQRLAQRTYAPAGSANVDPKVGIIGVCGGPHMGLLSYTRWSTTHEPVRVITGLNLETLPDRWYGLSTLSTLVWNKIDGGDPDDLAVSDQVAQAVREWVFRGGHLVIVLPDAGETWTASKFKDMLEPVGAMQLHQIDAVPPSDLYNGQLANRVPMHMIAFDVPEQSGYSVLITAESVAFEGQPAQDHAVAIGRRYGFGQVTLVGIDLSNTNSLLRSVTGRDSGFWLHQVWTRLLGWRAGKEGHLLSPSSLDDGDGPDLYTEMKDTSFSSHRVRLGDWIEKRVSKQAATGATLFLAILLFLIYGTASMLTFPAVLRSRGWDRYSWLFYVGLIAMFTTVAWGGAALFRPSKTAAMHFTVLDIDGNTNTVHARSWVSLFVARFGAVEIVSSSENESLFATGPINTIASPGMALSLDDPGYPDTQTYTFDAGQPDRMAFPIRATTKPFAIDFLGHISTPRDDLDDTWDMPSYSIKPDDNGMPRGTITNRFAGPLENVLIIYCPGGAGTAGDDGWKPRVWSYRDLTNKPSWAPGDMLTLPSTRSGGSEVLWRKPRPRGAPAPGQQVRRAWDTEGHLGRVVHRRGFPLSDTGSDVNLVDDMTLLSFYDALPPPSYERAETQSFGNYERNLLRSIDLTPLLTGRRLIIIGHLRDSTCPTPFTVDGETVPTEGWTVVRWIYDF